MRVFPVRLGSNRRWESVRARGFMPSARRDVPPSTRDEARAACGMAASSSHVALDTHTNVLRKKLSQRELKEGRLRKKLIQWEETEGS